MKKIMLVFAVAIFIVLNLVIVSSKSESSALTLKMMFKTSFADDEGSSSGPRRTTQECCKCEPAAGQTGAFYYCLTTASNLPSESCFEQGCGYGYC